MRAERTMFFKKADTIESQGLETIVIYMPCAYLQLSTTLACSLKLVITN